MKTALKTQIERNELNQIVTRFVYVTITPNKKESLVQAFSVAQDIDKYFKDLGFTCDIDQHYDDYVTVEFWEVDTFTQAEIKEAYRDYKTEAKQGTPQQTPQIQQATEIEINDLFGQGGFSDITEQELNIYEGEVKRLDIEEVAIKATKIERSELRKAVLEIASLKEAEATAVQFARDILACMEYTQEVAKMKEVIKNELFKSIYDLIVYCDFSYNDSRIRVIKEYTEYSVMYNLYIDNDYIDYFEPTQMNELENEISCYFSKNYNYIMLNSIDHKLSIIQ